MSDLDLSILVRDYGDVYGEARACRSDCALFDFSFMARTSISGARALTALARLQPRQLDDLRPGRIHYALRLDMGGAVLADLTIWNLGGSCYELMSGRRVDISELASFCDAGTVCEDLSDDTAVFAVQGPGSLAAFAGLTDTSKLAQLSYFGHDVFTVAGIECRIGRLGYTGEKGFELITPRALATELWRALAARIRPAGFAAADCLRIEAGFILFANECRFRVTPKEMGLSKFAGVHHTNNADARVRLVCFKAQTAERPVLWQPSQDTVLPQRRSEITVTSACHSVQEDCTVGLGYVRIDDAKLDNQVHDCTGYFKNIRLVSLPLYDPQKQKPRGRWPDEQVARVARTVIRSW